MPGGAEMSERPIGLWIALTARPGRGDDLAAAVAAADRMLSSVSACLVHVLGRSPDNSDELWVFEAWTSREAHAAWRASGEVAEILRECEEHILSREVTEVRGLGGKGVGGLA
jgi:quinol monooxygenase YgiN